MRYFLVTKHYWAGRATCYIPSAPRFGMRELAFALEFEPGANRVADALAGHPGSRIRSLSLHVTAERLWRVDHATGSPGALDDIEAAFLGADYYADCLATTDCGASQRTQVLDRSQQEYSTSVSSEWSSTWVRWLAPQSVAARQSA